SYGGAGWRGELEAHVVAGTEEPILDARARLVGALSTLDLRLAGTALGDSTFTASGPLLPQPEVTGEFAVGSGPVSGEVAWAEELSATLRTSEMILAGAVTVPALRVEVGVDTRTGQVNIRSAPAPGAAGVTTARDPSIDLDLRGSALSGGLRLPVLVGGT